MNIETINQITFGAENIVESGGYFVFSRFSDEERSAFGSDPVTVKNTYSTAGIKLDFITDAKEFGFTYRFLPTTSRNMAFFDVESNNLVVDSAGSMRATTEFGGEYKTDLPEGQNRVTVYFPNLFSLQIKDFYLTDYTVLKPAVKNLSVVAYGDSITQGYDAALPSKSYINVLSRLLNASVLDKAMGGDTFRPGLLEVDTLKTPDVVTVAYGTNDWSNRNRNSIESRVPLFFDLLNKRYPDSKIFIITPIWRKDFEKQVDFGTFDEFTSYLQDLSNKYSRFVCIKGLDIFPHKEDLLHDRFLHPNDEGMKIYAKGLFNTIKHYL